MSSHSNLSKFEKEKQKLIQDKCQTLLNDMLRDEDNKYCVDCDAKGPRWASWNLGIFLCIRCAGIHRNLGVHISRVKSVNLDSWTPEQVVTIQNMGNSRARAVYEANMPDNLRRPQTDSTLESFIRAKYEHKKYIAKEWVQPPPVKVNWDSEIEDCLRKSKETKKAASGTTDLGLGPVPSLGAITNKPSSSLATPTAKSPVVNGRTKVASQGDIGPIPIVPSSASVDLLGLTTDTPTTIPQPNLPQTEVVGTNSGSTTQASEDFGSIFLTSPSSCSVDLGKMSKESILSLYGSSVTNPIANPNANSNANPFIQSGANSPFGIGNLSSQFATDAPMRQMSSFSDAGGFPQIDQQPLQYAFQQTSNRFPGPHQPSIGMSPGYGIGNQTQMSHLTHVQNQMYGLNLANQQPQQCMNLGTVHPNFLSQVPVNSVKTNTTFQSNSILQSPRSENLPGLGNSVSQLMQPNLSGSSFWK